LFAFGSFLAPRTDFTNPADLVRSFDRQSDGERIGASAARGFGFLTLGELGLLVPWVNAYVFRQRGPVTVLPPSEQSA
jgi:hypothetical protein